MRLQIVRNVVLTVVGAAVVLAWAATVAVRAPSAAPPRVNGAYELSGSGPGVVTGRAVVNPGRVRIMNAEVINATGDRVAVNANLTMDRTTYHFTGTGTVGSSPARFSGRLDPDDTTLKKCRITGMFLAEDGTAGRFTGAHR